MADAGERPDGVTLDNDAPKASGNLLEQSYLAYVVPARTELDLESVFKDVDPGKPIFESIEQRELLLFDETVEVLLILKMPCSEEKDLHAQIKRLVISLECQIVNSTPADRSSQPVSETIFKGRAQDITDAFMLVDKLRMDSGHSSSQKVYAMWKLPVFLSRPRIRLQHPTVVFTASASVKPDARGDGAGTCGTGYLQSGMPSSFNLLESFSSDPALNGIKPRLSALRVSRVAPGSRQQDHVVHLRAQPRLRIPIHPVIHTRVRFSRPNTPQSTSSLVAMLEVDFTPHVDCEVVLQEIKLVTNDGTVQSLNDEEQMQLPMSCVSHDHITFLYHIKPHQVDQARRGFTGSLGVSITATAQVIPGVCTPKLTMSWNAALDFTVPVNPSFSNVPESSGIQRAHKPSQLSIGSSAAITPLKSPSITRPDALPGLDASARAEAAVPDLGITVSFTGPSEPVHPGDVFLWTVHVVNRSSEKTSRPPRKLALVAVPRRRRNDTRPARPPSTATRRQGEKEIADAVVDMNILHALQKNSAVDATDVICLSADTRVGPLAPGACHVAELQFLALREGIVGVEAVRVVDLGSQEHVDIRDLPTTVVEPAPA
ncbi:uncharacterized protein MAM_05697 [Metarhizium album ARSEF 1941]|uniref:Trafficking protein particle complex II-specific subunit 65 IgD3 domain-containing protein n=1 Tax=Metarhizium album (strain ARSEF 1941) TaxID=1081103 RepID=A0A0B2WQX0_METAS|nr:uncharacterized protein MAM_05697 [Metarhizium album ARSEF 1941]KHN96408.1 hypothetical protein MAM_05697 [Metarhizium album ARSEF 1941]